MKHLLSILFSVIIFYSCDSTDRTSSTDSQNTSKKIVLIAGDKSHGPGDHEYIKMVRLLKTMLDNANLEEITTEIHERGWPEDPSTLDEADLILFTSDGRDGDLFTEVPFMTDERMEVMERQMARGCGFSVIHFSTFAADSIGEKMLEWGGGYFDWEDERGERNWYSAIEFIEGTVDFPDSGHSILNGVKPFNLHDEFYYNIRFREEDPRITVIAEVKELEGRADKGNAVAWAVERIDGGRGFSTTMGHSYSSWEIDDFRKLMLNGIVWAAGVTIPQQGVEADFYSDSEVTKHLFGKSNKALILTGNNYPGHPWEETTPLIKEAIEEGSPIHVDVSYNIEDLGQYNLADYDVLILNYTNWEDPTPLSKASKDAFTNYLKEGGGLMVIHSANGAFHYSLPDAEESDWPEYREIVRRVWAHDSDSDHDNYQKFTVNITSNEHPITSGIEDFETMDELYFNQKGEKPITPLLSGKSEITGKEEPLAWIYNYGEGKVFQTVLGHDAKSFQSPEFRKILRNAAMWTGGQL